MVKELHDDVVLKEIIAALEKGEPTKQGFAYRRGVFL